MHCNKFYSILPSKNGGEYVFSLKQAIFFYVSCKKKPSDFCSSSKLKYLQGISKLILFSLPIFFFASFPNLEV